MDSKAKMFLAEVYMMLFGMIAIIIITTPSAPTEIRIAMAIKVAIGLATLGIVKYVFKKRG